MQHENTLSTAGLLPGLNIPTAQAARVSGTPQGIRVLRLARAVAAGLALMVSTMSAVRAADPIWDNNDYLIAYDFGYLVLDENFAYKAFVYTQSPISASGWGSLDWFANGDLMIAVRQDYAFNVTYQCPNENGSPYTCTTVTSTSSYRCATGFFAEDTKVAPNDQDLYTGCYSEGGVTRFVTSTDTIAQTVAGTWGAVAVARKSDGSNELWAGNDSDLGGIAVYPLAAADGSTIQDGDVNVIGSGSHANTMTFDPVRQRMLYPQDVTSIASSSIAAINVETHTLDQRYVIPDDADNPADSLPVGSPVSFQGVTAGENGKIVAVESYDTDPTYQPSRIGLSVWNLDGSGYRFIDLQSMAPSSGSGPMNVLWTGNSPVVRANNTSPAITCPANVNQACASASGSYVDISANVTDPDAGQTLTVSLTGGGNTRSQQIATPVDNESVSFNPFLMLGQNTVKLEVSDQIAVNSCSVQATLTTDTIAPVISGVPGDITVTATSDSGATVTFASPQANDACEGSVPVSCDPASGSTFPVGTTPVVCTAADSQGNNSTATFYVAVKPPTVSWSGVLQPINADGSSVFKAGRVVPVQFQLTGDSAGRTDLIAYLSYTKISDSVSGDVNEADAPGNANSGNQFKYDSSTGLYVFNWSTKGLTSGTYQLTIDLGDGVTHTVHVGLR